MLLELVPPLMPVWLERGRASPRLGGELRGMDCFWGEAASVGAMEVCRCQCFAPLVRICVIGKGST